ncbi:flagellar hook-length control protein FliK [Arthrobacter agilis]|uniref:flagellar hook-length control protein FliK n=1 Tax=Arthrobacter agilis TaxID=37921 RepID=UPI0027809657|nr:flagellar hook-length control protein FliK [Arthrobacter agilis]MDQ0737097.1 flagellar hook-length control protein FliK [Arthrobacter agilis]
MSLVQGSPATAAPRDTLRAVRPAAGNRDGSEVSSLSASRSTSRSASSFGEAYRRHAERLDRPMTRTADDARSGGPAGTPAGLGGSTGPIRREAEPVPSSAIRSDSRRGPRQSSAAEGAVTASDPAAHAARQASADPQAPSGDVPTALGVKAGITAEHVTVETAAPVEPTADTDPADASDPAGAAGAGVPASPLTTPAATPTVAAPSAPTAAADGSPVTSTATATPVPEIRSGAVPPTSGPTGPASAHPAAGALAPEAQGVAAGPLPGAGAVAVAPGTPVPVAADAGGVPSTAPTPAGAGAASAHSLPVGIHPVTDAAGQAAAGGTEAGGTDAGRTDAGQTAEPGTPAAAPQAGTTEQAGAPQLPPAARAELPLQQTPSVVVAPADAPAPARHAAPLPRQLGGPAFALAQAAAGAPGGTSTITVTVAPDDLGPITIRASLSPDGARIEFFSATDGGREALKQALPDLRREASSSGLSASLDLGTGTPDDPRDGARDHGPRHARTAEVRPAPAPPTWAARPAAGTSTLDLFA